MKKLPGFLEQRRINFIVLADELRGIAGLRVLPQPTGERLHSCHYCLAALLDKDLAARRPEIMVALAERGIGTSVYYPQPVPRMAYYRMKYGYDESQYANAARISDASIAFPVGPHLGPSHMAAIANNLRDIIKELTK
jgi:dTDP-4-amino-4,6-dideoxygalactose transaminase